MHLKTNMPAMLVGVTLGPIGLIGLLRGFDSTAATAAPLARVVSLSVLLVFVTAGLIKGQGYWPCIQPENLEYQTIYPLTCLAWGLVCFAKILNMFFILTGLQFMQIEMSFLCITRPIQISLHKMERTNLI